MQTFIGLAYISKYSFEELKQLNLKFLYIDFEYYNSKHFFIGDIGNYYYGQGHPMKPHRIRMTHNLLLNYGLYRKMEIYVSTSLKQIIKRKSITKCF